MTPLTDWTPVTEWTGTCLDAYDERRRRANADASQEFLVEERAGGSTGREYRVLARPRESAS